MKERLQTVKGFEFLLFFLSLFVVFSLGNGCSKKQIPSNRPNDPGDGEGRLDIEFWGTPPSSYNPNSQSRFEVSFQPTIENYTSGRCKILFKLRKADSVYAMSNCVDFPYYDTGVKTVEFGGALPDIETSCEEFDMRGFIMHYEDAIVTKWTETEARYITIERMNPPTKTMNIEYDYQDSDTSAVDSYDIFSVGKDVERLMNITFNVANTGFDIWVSDENLDAELVVNTPEAVFNYAQDHRVDPEWGTGLYLCGVKGFRNANEDTMTDDSGLSLAAEEDGTFGVSLVGIKAIMKTNYYYEAVIPKVTIHELGFQRSDDIKPPEDHPEQHNSVFCVMYRGADLPDRNLYYNPHFCESCVTKLKAVNW